MSKETAEALASKTPDLEGADIRDNIDDINEGSEYEPLFKDESLVDESVLQGESDPGEKTANPEPKDAKPEKKDDKEDRAEETKPKDEKEPEKKDDEKQDTKEKDDKDPASEEKPEKPPAGFVPQEALHEERSKLKSVRAELEQSVAEVKRLSAELKTVTTRKPDDKEAEEFKDFKPLSTAEFNELVDEDPDAAQKYTYQHQRYSEYLKSKQEGERAEIEAKRSEENIINSAGARIDEMLPGVFKGENDLAKKLGEFATENGVSPPVVDILTNPKTKVITDDGRHLLLGHGAAELVGLLKSAFEKVSAVPDENSLREKIIEEVTPEIEARLQKELIAKLQNDPSGFVSLDDAPGSDKRESKPSVTGIMTESDYARMSESERQAMLGG